MNIVTAVLKLLFLILTTWLERDKKKKEKKKKAINQVKDGIATNDNSKILAGFAKANR